MKTNIRGVGVALVTPFTDEDGIDFAALDKLIERVIGGGADYLVALGTTAETPALSGSEKEAILRFVVESSGPRRQFDGRCRFGPPFGESRRGRCRAVGDTLLQ